MACRHEAVPLTEFQKGLLAELAASHADWLAALDDAESFVRKAPPDDVGCLYYQLDTGNFVQPAMSDMEGGRVVRHYGRPGGVVPRLTDTGGWRETVGK